MESQLLDAGGFLGSLILHPSSLSAPEALCSTWESMVPVVPFLTGSLTGWGAKGSCLLSVELDRLRHPDEAGRHGLASWSELALTQMPAPRRLVRGFLLSCQRLGLGDARKSDQA